MKCKVLRLIPTCLRENIEHYSDSVTIAKPLTTPSRTKEINTESTYITEQYNLKDCMGGL